MKIPEDIKKIVSFVWIRDPQGNPGPIGTGFFVSVPNEVDSKISHIYFVSAKHVFKDENGVWFPSFFIRLNRKESKAEFIEIKILHHEKPGFSLHDDDSVDIAVLQFPINLDKYDLKLLPASMLVTREVFKKEEIREGDDVFFLGLFISHFGQERNYPIARFGKVALLTDERVEWDNKDCELYLMECQVFGGNSGAPVFFNFGMIREPGKITHRSTQTLLAGVMIGYFGSRTEVRVVNSSPIPFVSENAGIAAVVPAHLLQEILFSSELVSVRKEIARNIKKQSSLKEKKDG